MIHGVVRVGLKVILHVTLFFRPIALRQLLVSHNPLLPTTLGLAYDSNKFKILKKNESNQNKCFMIKYTI